MVARGGPAPGCDGTETTVHASTEGGVLTLTLDHPERLNAVSADDLDAMTAAMGQAVGDPDVKVVVLAGEGRAFCSGANVAPDPDRPTTPASTLDAGARLVLAITQAPRPVVARARGVVAGIGVSIALACDLVLCDEDSYLLLAFTRIGLMPDGGATDLVARSVGRARAMRLALLAEKLPAGEALAAGLVTHVWPAADYDREAALLVDRLAQAPAAALGRAKLAVNAATLPGLPAALELERTGQLDLLASADFAEGALAFLERRPAVFTDAPLSGRL